MAIFNDFENSKEIFDLIEKFDKSNLLELEITIPPPPAQCTKIKMIKLSRDTDLSDFKTAIETSDGIEKNLEFKKNNPAIDEEITEATINAPLVGTFYVSPSPDSAPYVQIGDIVKKGTVLCIIEAMKTMNEIESEFDGEISDILVKNGNIVEFGQPLFKIKV